MESLDILFDGSYSPFEGLMNMPCKTNIVQMKQQTEICGLKFSFLPVDHGNSSDDSPTYAFRIESPEGEVVSIVTDHEARPSPINDRVVEFVRDSHVLIHDGQFLESEYPNYVGWGHSTAEQALENGLRSGAGQVIITHHDPNRSDRELQSLHRKLIKIDRYKGMQFDFAREEIDYAVTLTTPHKKAG